MKSNLELLKEMTQKLNLMESDLLRKAMDMGTDGYWDWHVGSGEDGDEDYEYMSPRFKEIFGYNDDELPNVPSSWQKLMNPDDLNVMFGEVTKHFESGGEYEFSSVGRYTHKEGHEVKVLCRGAVIEWGENGEPLRMIGTHTDITGL